MCTFPLFPTPIASAIRVTHKLAEGHSLYVFFVHLVIIQARVRCAGSYELVMLSNLRPEGVNES